MRKRTLVAAAALATVPVVALGDMACTYGPGTYIRTKLVSENGTPLKQSLYEVVLLQLPGGTADTRRTACAPF